MWTVLFVVIWATARNGPKNCCYDSVLTSEWTVVQDIVERCAIKSTAALFVDNCATVNDCLSWKYSYLKIMAHRVLLFRDSSLRCLMKFMILTKSNTPFNQLLERQTLLSTEESVESGIPLPSAKFNSIAVSTCWIRIWPCLSICCRKWCTHVNVGNKNQLLLFCTFNAILCHASSQLHILSNVYPSSECWRTGTGLLHDTKWRWVVSIQPTISAEYGQHTYLNWIFVKRQNTLWTLMTIFGIWD